MLSFDYTTVWAIAVFFGFGFIIGGIMELGARLPDEELALAAHPVRDHRHRRRDHGAHLAGQTFLVLAAIIGWYVLFAGIFDIVTAFATKDENDLWWLQLILGIAQILIGFWAIGYTGRSIDLLVIWVGASALARGISSLFLAFGLRGAGKEVRKRMIVADVVPPPAITDVSRPAHVHTRQPRHRRPAAACVYVCSGDDEAPARSGPARPRAPSRSTSTSSHR